MSLVIDSSPLLDSVLAARKQRIEANPNSEESLNPLIEEPKQDTISLSDQAEKYAALAELRKNAPRIDWENRTYRDKPIPDNWLQHPTKEMLAGEQPFSAWAGFNGQTIYVEEELTAVERIVQSDLQLLSGMQQHVSNAQNMEQEYSLLAPKKDPTAAHVMNQNTKHISGMAGRLLENVILGYTKMGIDLLDADRIMGEMSLGQFSLADMIEDYFGVDIREQDTTNSN